MGFTKLDENILLSSIMSEDSDTFKVWIALLASCRENGISPATIPYLSSVCRIDIKKVQESIVKLSSPDEFSRSLENEGRRIERVDGGFSILNYHKYRERTYSDSSTAIRQRRFREKKALHSVTCNDVTESNGDISASASASAAEEKEKETRKIVPPKIEWVTEYCNERKNNVTPQKWYDFYQSKNWMIGKNKMKDWQAAVRTWENNPSQRGYEPKNTDKPKTSSNWSY